MSVTEALMAQLEEYKSSVDNTEKFGVHKSLIEEESIVFQLQNELDRLIFRIDDHLKRATEFSEAYKDQMKDKARKKRYEE